MALGVANGKRRGRGVGSRARSRGRPGTRLWGRDRAAVERRAAPAGGRGPGGGTCGQRPRAEDAGLGAGEGRLEGLASR